MVWRLFYSLAVLGGVFCGWPTVCPAQETVDFERDIQPILQQHCWKCHGEQRAAGGLRLDLRHLAERGGGSGKNVLALSAESNELLRRVRSMLEGERMPVEGPPLSAEQITTLERWIAQGAAWPVKVVESPKIAFEAPQPSQFDIWLDRWEYFASPRYRPAYIAAIGVLLLMLVVERCKKTKRRLNSSAGPVPRNAIVKRISRLSRAWYLVGLLGIAVFLVVQYAREQTERAQRKENVRIQPGAAPRSVSAEQKLHDPFRPQHPPRLGGAYYRGNDERGEGLFNGGFYRTATFHVHLSDAAGNDLAWGDPLPQQPHIRFEIARSPHASPSLFGPGIMDAVGLSPVQPEQLATAAEIPFVKLQTLEAGERWSALYPLEDIPAQGKLAGKLYVYKGSTEDQTHRRDEPSYLIGYELSADDGRISPTSQIWMASVYNVSVLQWPEPGRIPADHWFDFRPIPEIVK